MKKFISLSVMFATVSCGSKDSQKSTPATPVASGMITAAELEAPSNVTALEKMDLQSDLLYSDYLATDADDTGTTDCFAVTLKTAAANAKLVVLGTKVTADFTADLSACYKELLEGSGGTNVSGTYVVASHSVIDCTGKDVTSFNGKTIDTFDEFSQCTDGFGYLHHFRGTTDMKATIAGADRAFKTVTLNASSSDTNDLCHITITNGQLSETGCIDIASVTESGTTPKVSYHKAIHKDLQWVQSTEETWYSAGSMALTVNDWAGTLTFTAAKENPTYTMTKGTDTATGSLIIPGASLGSPVRHHLLPSANIVPRVVRNGATGH